MSMRVTWRKAAAADPTIKDIHSPPAQAYRAEPNRPAVPGILRLHVQERREDPPGSGQLKVVARTVDWKVAETAIIVCDMWDDHHCKLAAQRVSLMAPRMNQVLWAARDRGVMIIPDVYLNAGGVTVSYFEWVKNLSHVRFGRVGKRFEEAASERMLRAIEAATGRVFSPDEHRIIARGADETDLVNSGLEETMIGAYRQIRELMRRDERVTDLRTAAFLSALRKIGTSYMELGIFP